MDNTEELIQQFLAKGGEIRKVEPAPYTPHSVLAKTGAERFFERRVIPHQTKKGSDD